MSRRDVRFCDKCEGTDLPGSAKLCTGPIVTYGVFLARHHTGVCMVDLCKPCAATTNVGEIESLARSAQDRMAREALP
jgi:hypothetical protein